MGLNICARPAAKGSGLFWGPVVTHPLLFSQLQPPQRTLTSPGVAAGSVTCEALLWRGRNCSSEGEQTSPRKPGETARNEVIVRKGRKLPQELRKPGSVTGRGHSQGNTGCQGTFPFPGQGQLFISRV